jgi:catechol 2,3-dioxygenase-like lactoylglutathione lyase family enzyme
MNIGGASLCLNVKNVKESFDFYMLLGFKVEEEHLDQNWAIISHRGFVIGLFQECIEENLINFRGGNIPALKKWLEEKNIKIESIESINEDGTGSFYIRDKDGNLIYMDTTLPELEDIVEPEDKK